MLKKAFILLLPLTLLVASCCLAQDAGVKGSGAIAASDTTVGQFSVSVAQTGNVLLGGFKYAEYGKNSTSTRPLHVIYSQRLVSLQVSGDLATVQAVGYWNGMLSDLTIEGRDRGSAGVDWFHITARPRGAILIIYDKAGDLIRGDLVVFGATPVPGYTTGLGAIQVGVSTGTFRFKAAHTSAGVAGYAYYSEFAPTMSPVSRPRVCIYLPKATWLIIIGKTARFGGVGMLNGRPAIIEIKGVDKSPPTGTLPPTVPDEFTITATPLTNDSITPGYSAGGPLIKGDIVVAPL